MSCHNYGETLCLYHLGTNSFHKLFIKTDNFTLLEVCWPTPHCRTVLIQPVEGGSSLF